MGRKVLLSFLGLGDYQECIYEYQGKFSTPTRFVQTAILEYMKDDGLTDLVVFATKEAKAQNWKDRVHENDDRFFEGMENTLQRITPDVNVKLVDINSSQDEEANWSLFDAIISEIQEGDEIYLDITHSFRSIPFVALIVLNYARLIKKASIQKVMYGLFDSKHPDKPAPLVDVTSMVALFDWTVAVDQFLKTGDAEAIQELTSSEARVAAKKDGISPEEKKKIGALKDLAQQLNRVGQTLRTCRSIYVSEETQRLHYRIKLAKEVQTDKIRPLVPLLDEIESKYKDFSDDEIMNLYYSAKWCSHHHLIQQGITLLQENCVTAICKVFGIPVTDDKKRPLVNSAIKIILGGIPEEEWKVEEEKKLLLGELVAFLQPYKELLAPFEDLTNYRNDINHAGTNSSHNRKLERFQMKLNEVLQEIKPFFEKMSELAKEKSIE